MNSLDKYSCFYYGRKGNYGRRGETCGRPICAWPWPWRRRPGRRGRFRWAASSSGTDRWSDGAANRREEKGSALSHAEVEAIAQANAALGDWRLEDCELYVTLEPCPMCAGAILNARIPRVWFGARDRVMGACGGVINLFMEDFPNRPALVGGVLEEECRQVLTKFFSKPPAADAGDLILL